MKNKEFFKQTNNSGCLTLSPQEENGLQFKTFNFMFVSFVPNTEQKKGEGWNTNIHLQATLVPSQYVLLGRLCHSQEQSLACFMPKLDLHISLPV